MKNEQLLWIGSLEEDKEYGRKMKNGFDQTSAQLAQKGIISGIEFHRGVNFDSINGSVVNYFPLYQEKYVHEIRWSHKEDALDVSVGFNNIKYLSKILCKEKMIIAATEWLKTRYDLKKQLIVFVYSLRSAPMETAIFIKKKVPTAKLVLIITDLPQYMDLGQSKIKAMLKKIDFFNIKYMLPKFDNYVLYASKMAEYLGIPDGKWMLMEGFYNPGKIEYRQKTIPFEKRIIFYAGMLSLQYGIGVLVDSFMEIADDRAELWLAGTGNAENYIKECANKDSRIKFLGLLPREEVVNRQLRSTCLINMRLPSNAVSAYSFPSKIFEYLASGVPTLSFKLDGIPKEYYSYLITIESKEVLRDVIENTFNMDDKSLLEIGNAGRTFVLENKTVEKQTDRICKFIWEK